jgi:3-methyladenine DNA glycosylase/8-oxoguanine DNA glycosylase
MWYNTPKNRPDWAAAEAHLAGADPKLGAVIRRIGPCGLAPLGRFPGDAFVVLAKALFSQQISSGAAAAIWGRYRGLFPRRRPTAVGTLGLSDAVLREVGLSRQKVDYLRDLAGHFDGKRLPLKRFPQMTDDEIVAALTEIHGIGRWTAEMFLMFVLVRPDVFPVADLGIQKSVAAVWGLEHPVGKERLVGIAERWRPFRTVACWYLWRMSD